MKNHLPSHPSEWATWDDNRLVRTTISESWRKINEGISPQKYPRQLACETAYDYAVRVWYAERYRERVQDWLKTPRGMRWTRRCADNAEKRRGFALTDVALALVYKYNKLSREAGDYPEWSGDEAYDCIRLLLKHNIISVSEGE
jgi:hypothetical protein